jgi:hypothetical protein
MSNTLISLDDIKFDLLKIIEPYDGILSNNEFRPVLHLFNRYLGDLKRDSAIREYNVKANNRDEAVTYDVSIRLTPGRAPKKLKIHVGKFKQPWCLTK